MLNQKIPIKITNINNDIADIKITDDDFNLTEKELDNKFELQFLSLEPGYRTGVRKEIPCVLFQNNFKFRFKIRRDDLFYLLNKYGCAPNAYINEYVYLLKQGKYYNIYDHEKFKELSNPKKIPTIPLEYGKAYGSKCENFIYLGKLKNNKRKIFINYYGKTFNNFLELFQNQYSKIYSFYCRLQKTKTAYKEIDLHGPIPDIHNLKNELARLKSLIEKDRGPLSSLNNLNIILKDEIIP